MDCKSFTSKHAAFIDDTLPGVDMSAMRVHINECMRCARRDADVRRALLLVRNLPPVQVSEGFQDRLRARLAAESAVPVPARPNVQGAAIKWTAAAGLLIAIVTVASKAGIAESTPGPVRLPAVVASSPAAPSDATDDSASAYLASMSTGIPMWPALMLAEEGPLRFAAAELHASSWDASRPH